MVDAPSRPVREPRPLPLPLTLPVHYPVYCARGVLQHVGEIVRTAAPAHRYAVLTDDTIRGLYADRVRAQLGPSAAVGVFSIPPGEQQKTRERWMELTDALTAWGAGRDTTVVALGGGVVGDLAGFVAATFMRGIPVVQVPTTLLAMVDASVGGKTAVDTPLGKNLVGAFHHPNAVVMDPDVLSTLPPELLRAGLAEMLKHGVVADQAYFDAVRRALPQVTTLGASAPDLASLVAGSVRIKAGIVAEDTTEGGLRQVLNFGHTVGHAIERELDYTIAHGEAVAIGMVVESHVAEVLGLAAPGLRSAVFDAVDAAGLPTRLPQGVSIDGLVSATHGDKKSRSGEVRYALPRVVGEMESAGGRWSVAVDDDVVRASLRLAQEL